jgi:thiol-disulfide isomerase/thioredoxin
VGRSIVIAALALALFACDDAKRQNRALPEDFRAITFTDDVLDRAALTGKPWVISVWRPGCAPCMRQLASLDQVKARHAGVGFLALSLEPDEDKIFDAAGRAEVDSTLAWSDGDVMVALALKSVPSTVFLDRNATIVASVAGEHGEDALEKWLAVAAP